MLIKHFEKKFLCVSIVLPLINLPRRSTIILSWQSGIYSQNALCRLRTLWASQVLTLLHLGSALIQASALP